MLNLFMNTYKQPENKLTYNFLCVLSKIDKPKEFIEYLIDNSVKLKDYPIINIHTVFSGNESNPDGLIEVDSENGCIKIYLECKTYRLKLTSDQLKNHMKIHFVDSNDKLLVITPRQSDSQIVKSLNSQKVYFKTWHEIAAKLNQINKEFENKSIIISDFIEYGQITGEFENMSEIDEKELSAYIKTKVMKTEDKIFAIFEKAFNEIDFENYNIRNLEYKTSNNWGRMGIEITSNKQNDYGQWFFWGIYYKTYDHGIPFKKIDTPEIAFFLDITPQSRTELIKDKDLLESLNTLKQLGFENNLTEQITPNNWRFLFKRIPLTEFKNLNVDSCKNFINEILTDLNSEKYFLKKFF